MEPKRHNSQPAGGMTGLPVWEKESVQDPPQNPFVYNDTPSMSPANKSRNVILFGETGVGKSSVINLMAGREVASTSPNLEGCTLQAAEYSFTLKSLKTSFRIFDTTGLEEPEMGVNTFIGAIEQALKLITSLHDAGGVDLLLFCVKAGRLTAAMQRNYRLFYEIMCNNQVSLAVVVTNLENEDIMEEWWGRNKLTFERYRIRAVTHACITAIPARVTLFEEKRVQSQRALQELFHEALSRPKPSYIKDIRSWFVTLLERLGSLLPRGLDSKKKFVAKRLETHCALPHLEAQRLAEIMARR